MQKQVQLSLHKTRFDLHHHSHKAYEGDNLALAHSLPQSLLLHRPLLLRLPPILLG